MSHNAEIVKLENVTKTFEDGVTVLDNLNLSVYQNEFLTLLGPSGCGKTTTLRIIGGFEHATKGNVYFKGKIINELPPYKRTVNTVFQKYALFPHMNVFDNIAFGLTIKKLPKDIINDKVIQMLKLVGLQGFEKRMPDSLSGGQQQRVAIARALVNEPDLLLLDEPLGALDLKLRKEMQIELKRIQTQLGITFVYVTHDQEEALTMSDRIVVMNNGLIQQLGSPVDIYNEPLNAFVADFIGESNILNGTMIKDKLVSFEDREFVCVDGGFGENAPVQIVVRPEDIDLVPKEKGMFSGVVRSVVFMGVHYEMIVETNNFKWLVHSTDYEPEGSVVGMTLTPDDIHIMKPSEEDNGEK